MVGADQVAEGVAVRPADGIGAIGVVHKVLVDGQHHVDAVAVSLVEGRQLAEERAHGVVVAHHLGIG